MANEKTVRLYAPGIVDEDGKPGLMFTPEHAKALLEMNNNGGWTDKPLQATTNAAGDSTAKGGTKKAAE